MEDQQEQEDELLALEAIYPDTFHKLDNDLRGGRVDVAVELPGPISVLYTGKEKTKTYVTEYLPPVSVIFVYPDLYPSLQPPALTVQCTWLTDQQKVSVGQYMADQWEEGLVVLFTALDWLQREMWTFLKLQPTLSLDIFGITASRIYDVIVEYDEHEKQRAFNNSYFPCTICLNQYMGSDCFRFYICGHVFCKVCIKGYFAVQITDGAVGRLVCAVPGCKKQALPNEVKALVTPEEFERYERLQLQTTLDSMGDIVYCPRKACGSAVLREPDAISPQTGKLERNQLGRCSACGFSFCILCRRSWHGVDFCAPSDLDSMIKKYEACETDAERDALHEQYGAQIYVVAREMLSRQWLKENTKSCPVCKAGIEKNSGCNKMTCQKCNAYFCWLCMDLLSHDDPYQHYRRGGGPCANRLFQGMEEGEGDEEFIFEQFG